MSFHLAHGEELVNCPYDKSHFVRHEKLSSHLEKCRRNYYKGVQELGASVHLSCCRYNSSHQFPEIERGYHEGQCQDRKVEMPSLPPVPRKVVVPPTRAEIREFKKLVADSKMDIGEDWELESVLDPQPHFFYNHANAKLAYALHAEASTQSQARGNGMPPATPVQNLNASTEHPTEEGVSRIEDEELRYFFN